MTLRTFGAQTFDGTQAYITVKAPPDVCPRCHYSIAPIFRYGSIKAALPTSGRIDVQAVYQCPRGECRELFLALFRYFENGYIELVALLSREFELVGIGPISPRTITFETEIVEASPSFVSLYNEAATAETMGLLAIAGPGYGKSLEFLIKDYLIARTPDDASAIKAEFLGNVIAQRVDDPRLKSAAERAAWLRNDESHYERKWIDKDLADLKTLIKLSVNWIHSSLLTDKIAAEMPRPAKGK